MKRLLCAALALLMLAGCAGCSVAPASEGLTAKLVKQNVTLTDPCAGDAAALADFSAALFEGVRGMGDSNPVISPISAFYALSMAAAGARGDTAAQFADVLGVPSDVANGLSASLAARLTNLAGGTELTIGNSLWLQRGQTPMQDYLQTVKDYYGANVYDVNFSDGGTLGKVQKWVEDATNGFIKNVPADINPETIMLLINALYMDAKWREQFSGINTRPGDFTTASGATVQADYLNSLARSVDHIITGEVEGALLPYNDGALAFLIVKPLAGGVDSLHIGGDSISEWVSAAAARGNVILSMPKFELEYKLELRGVLEDMGLIDAFGDADFSGMLEGGQLWINGVWQAVRIKVNEEGTEAAAVTGVTVAGAAIADAPYLLTFDSPYIYAVVDLETNLPLFIGVMHDPTLKS